MDLYDKIRAGFFVIAGPCVIESRELAMSAAFELKEICAALGITFIYKSSYDKANRTSINSFRGAGPSEHGLQILNDIREKYNVAVLTDIHSAEEAAIASEVVDIIQIPALLSRQTDIIIAASNTGKTVNIKKGQFMAPWDVKNVVAKFTSTGNTKLLITERGTTFGYGNLVVDFRGIPIMKQYGHPVVFDATHSVQLPGGLGNASGGERKYVPTLARAGVAAGCDGLFMEVHPEPDKALCDGPNMINFETAKSVLKVSKSIYDLINSKSS
ncbi:3-deoxy-8-phosphooctulonate synthase [Candidatus Magnetomonas plexicatena]|uniref:3-deoxy-8-phosphooctulonate synthase n=1 Tax=Candidatus Magnetomonas plexicatena TaxID=2552947 RepID=UPI001C75995F|nr:3-deoxy-8-phosphooctulonate synthase [Nitrospirales bacterium LBB_01]